jgi:thiol-disulfide isomerase/thioredoxin
MPTGRLSQLAVLVGVLMTTVSGGGGQAEARTIPALESATTAPDFPAHLDWLNTGRKLSLKEFRGKFVLLDFWTFCCINCMHIIPDLKRLEAKYPEELVVIGVHSAKFTNEKDTAQIRQAILRYGIQHPVVNDRNFDVWRNYDAQAWPTIVLINPKGKIIAKFSGEGIFEPFDRVLTQAIHYFAAKGELKRAPLGLALERAGRANMLLDYPGKISADGARQLLFVTDTNHHRIVVSSLDGAIQDVIGSGEPGFEDGSFEKASFHQPQGTVLVDDVLYVADTENHAIRAANLRTRQVATVLGSGRQSTKFNVAGRGRSVDLSSPWDVAFHAGKLYIAMAGSHQIWVADTAGWDARPHAGSGREARMDGSLLEAALAQPSSLSTDGRKLYFADSETSSIRMADLDPGGKVTTIVGEDLFEFGDRDGKRSRARLQHPLGVAYHDGLLYVADTYNSKIKIVDPARGASRTYAGTGKHGMSDGSLQSATFNEPGGLAILGSKIYVADTNNHQIRVVHRDAGRVSSLEFTGVEKLAPAAGRRFQGREIALALQRLRPGRAKLRVGVALPAGTKFANNAPQYLKWSASDAKLVGFRMEAPKKPEFPVEVALDTAAGSGELIVESITYYCTPQSPACFVDSVRLRVPVQVVDGGVETLSVTVPVKAPKL